MGKVLRFFPVTFSTFLKLNVAFCTLYVFDLLSTYGCYQFVNGIEANPIYFGNPFSVFSIALKFTLWAICLSLSVYYWKYEVKNNLKNARLLFLALLSLIILTACVVANNVYLLIAYGGV